VKPDFPLRLLSIGEFSAATQLSPKALRLYDEQRILQPARIHSGSGYRYYGNDQVALGRLIRTLRDMNMPLADVTRIVQSDRRGAEQVLSQFAGELDRRYARDKRALQAALLLLRESERTDSLAIEERSRPAMTVVVYPFVADRVHFYERLRSERDTADAALTSARLRPELVSYCRLIDPLSDDEAQVELLIPVDPAAPLPGDITLRQLTQVSCAVMDITASDHVSDFSAPVDALFDWFDRRGYRAVDVPWLARTKQGEDLRTEVLWAYEAHSHSGGQP
jgi:DNA-binding transcriptional MerR regulator